MAAVVVVVMAVAVVVVMEGDVQRRARGGRSLRLDKGPDTLSELSGSGHLPLEIVL